MNRDKRRKGQVKEEKKEGKIITNKIGNSNKEEKKSGRNNGEK